MLMAYLVAAVVLTEYTAVGVVQLVEGEVSA